MSLSKTTVLLVGVSLLVVLAGCPSISHTPDPAIQYDGEINATDAGFQMDGYFHTTPGNNPVYENVTLFLYETNGSRIETRSLGTLEETLSITVTTEKIPAFVLVDSPDFFQQNEFSVTYFEYQGGEGVQYSGEWAEDRSDFPMKTDTSDD